MMKLIFFFFLDLKHPFRVTSFRLSCLIWLCPGSFGKLVKIPENTSALQSFLLTNDTELDNMFIQYFT